MVSLILFSGPIWGFLGAAVGVFNAHSMLTMNRGLTPEQLSEPIAFALVTKQYGLISAFVGAVLLLVCLFGVKNRERWFYHWVVALSVIHCFLFVPLGIFVWLPFFLMRKQFPPFVQLR
jgi:hypothetical protein